MFFKIINFLDHSYSRNVAFAFIMGVFCIVSGSTSTALLVASSVVLIFLNPKVSTKEIWQKSLLLIKKIPIIGVFPVFYLFVVVTSFQGDDWLKDVFFVAGSYWQFLIMVPASIGLYHLSKDVNFAGLFSYGCRFGLLFVVPLSLVQIYFFNLRPEGIFSNALVFASLCITGAGLAMIEWPEDTHRARTWSWIVFTAGILAALLTFSRGMLLPIGAIIIITVYYRFKINSRYKLDRKIIAIISIAITGIFATSIYSDNGWRFISKRVLEPIKMYNTDQPFDRSISQRLDMQITGFHAFIKQPLMGHGIQNAVDEANSVSQEVLGRRTQYTYTHLHNDYLTHAVGGGIVLLLLFILVIFSPIFMCWHLRKSNVETGLFYFSLIISGAFSTIGMTNIVFHNDQLTTMFTVACMFVIARRIQIIDGMHEVRIPNLPTIANGINPIGLLPEKISPRN